MPSQVFNVSTTFLSNVLQCLIIVTVKIRYFPPFKQFFCALFHSHCFLSIYWRSFLTPYSIFILWCIYTQWSRSLCLSSSTLYSVSPLILSLNSQWPKPFIISMGLLCTWSTMSTSLLTQGAALGTALQVKEEGSTLPSCQLSLLWTLLGCS